MADDSAKLVAEAVRKGVQDIIASYNEAIDKFVADPDVKVAIKVTASKLVLKKLFERLTNMTKPEAEVKEPEPKVESDKVDPHSFPHGLSSWPDERF